MSIEDTLQRVWPGEWEDVADGVAWFGVDEWDGVRLDLDIVEDDDGTWSGCMWFADGSSRVRIPNGSSEGWPDMYAAARDLRKRFSRLTSGMDSLMSYVEQSKKLRYVMEPAGCIVTSDGRVIEREEKMYVGFGIHYPGGGGRWFDFVELQPEDEARRISSAAAEQAKRHERIDLEGEPVDERFGVKYDW